eukprot:jgi/Mesen1/7803/ME000408S06912
MSRSFSDDNLIGNVDVSKNLKKKQQPFVRADLLDLANLDAEISKRFGSRGDVASKVPEPKEAVHYEWQIDMDKLVLGSVIAQGSYGTVHRGTYEGKEVAVKLLDWGEEDTMSRSQLSVLRQAFQQEVTVWSKLDHPNITGFLGASMGGQEGFAIPSLQPGAKGGMRVSGNICCVVVEYVPGGNLKDYLIRHRRKKLPLKTVVQLALDMARGLDYLHSKKIVHRDVKTENMLLDKRNCIKIADFGVARVESANPMDMTGETGTLGYMAPEVLDGKPYNRKADVYSYGICLWEMYACDMPFPSLTLKEMQAVVKQGLRPTVPSCCPPALSNVMRRCWSSAPKDRPQMNEVVKMLEGVSLKGGRSMIADDLDPHQSCFCFGKW